MLQQQGPTSIYYDNVYSIKLSKNPLLRGIVKVVMESCRNNTNNTKAKQQWRAEETIDGNREALGALTEHNIYPIFYPRAQETGLKKSARCSPNFSTLCADGFQHTLNICTTSCFCCSN
ncbi:unnamed protein product [Prunus brigantina]